MNLDEFISCMGVVLYGKERFFRQENALWYDRNYADYVSTEDGTGIVHIAPTF